MGSVNPVTRPDGGATPPNRNRQRRWAIEFPYGWSADDQVSRRELLRLAVFASGALFAATGFLAGLGYARDRTRQKEQPIAATSAVPPGGVHYFDYIDDQQAILLHLDTGQFVAYSGKCTHLSCAVYWHGESGELRCPCHDGVFDPRTGNVVAGPPTRPLEKIALRQEGDMLIAVAQMPS